MPVSMRPMPAGLARDAVSLTMHLYRVTKMSKCALGSRITNGSAVRIYPSIQFLNTRPAQIHNSKFFIENAFCHPLKPIPFGRPQVMYQIADACWIVLGKFFPESCFAAFKISLACPD